ncbi:MAG: hypothetical protein IKR39_10935 [Lachnospiraceae bacterium]|nr:hypothetical protein [Lachnospiraceae bacterium]
MITLDGLKYGLHFIASATAQTFDTAYDLIVVDDEATPLSNGPLSVNYYPTAIIAVAAIAVIALLTVWFIRRSGYKSRLLELRAKAGDKSKAIPLTIRGIKDAVKEAEKNLITI